MKKALSDGQTRCFEETLTRDQAQGEFLFLNLRQLEGMPLSAFAERFGSTLLAEFPHVGDLLAEGLLQEREGRLALTPQGLLLADSIFSSFF